MGLRLRPGLQQVWRRPGRLQLGLDPRHGVLLDGLSPADERLLAALQEGTDLRALLALARSLGAGEARAHELLAELRAAGALAPPPTVRSRLARLPDPLRRRLSPDATALGMAHADGDGWHVLAGRRTRCVAVVGAGRTGLGIAVAAAAGGIGCVLLDDPGLVTEADLAPGGYREDDVGLPRVQAARQVLAAGCPHTRTAVRGRARPDLVVLVAHGAVDPARADGLLREDVAHLAVVWGELGVVVGPLVVPGRSSCLRCAHLHRTDRDPEWPRVVAQLVAPGTRPRPGEETSLAQLASALAAGQLLAWLDGAAPATLDGALEVGLPERDVVRRSWPAHSRCGCRWPPGLAGSAPAGTMAR
jgi:hypothetical protein